MWSVVCPTALTTATTRRPPATRAATRRAARRILAGVPSDVPPNLTTRVSRTALIASFGRVAETREGGVEVDEEVGEVLEADGEADEVGRDARGAPFLLGELLVRRRPGVDDEALGVADVGDEREEPQARDQVLRGLLGSPPRDAEGQHPAEPAGEVAAAPSRASGARRRPG